MSLKNYTILWDDAPAETCKGHCMEKSPTGQTLIYKIYGERKELVTLAGAGIRVIEE